MARSAVLLVLLAAGTPLLDAQVVLEGRLLAKRHPGSTEDAPLSKVLVFASLDGSGTQALQCRTWESEPAGWYYLSGSSGNYTVLFSSPAHFLRPVVLDGGYVQKAGGLSGIETYRLAARVRSSWPVDAEHQCLIGLDPTGQDEDPRAPTIAWTAFPPLHGHFVSCLSEPIRPRDGSISVWLRGRTTLAKDTPFKADFDDASLRRVETGAPAPD